MYKLEYNLIHYLHIPTVALYQHMSYKWTFNPPCVLEKVGVNNAEHLYIRENLGCSMFYQIQFWEANSFLITLMQKSPRFLAHHVT